MARTLPLVAAVVVAVLATVAGPALSADPYRPKPVDFELTAPAPKVSAARGAHEREYVSPPLRAPKRFNVVGLRWRGSADHAHLRLRVKRDGGKWSKWHELHAGSAEGPDRRRGEPVVEGASGPAWAGHADWVQYRSERRLPGARLHFVNTTGTATTADRRRTAFRRSVNRGVVALAKLPGALVPDAGAAEPQPPMVSRDGWGARNCTPRGGPAYGEVHAAFVHHTVNINDYSREEAASVVLGICRYHRNSQGWNDIGYNFLVDKYGTIYEGRAGGADQPIVGAQAQGFNSVSTGIANIGTFESVPQSNEALGAMARLIRWKLPLHGAPTAGTVTVRSAGGSSSRYPAGASATINRVSGHRDGNNTACPGTALYNQLPELRRRVGDVAATGSAVRRTVAYPQPVQITGNLRDLGVEGGSGQPIHLERQSTTGVFKPVVRGTTGGDGSYALSFAPSKRAVVRVRYPGDGSRPAAESPPYVVQVRPQLGWTPPPKRVRPRALITVPGTIAPRKGSVRLVVERRSGKGRRGKVATVKASARTGKFKARIRITGPGLYRMRVVFPGDSKNLAARSKFFFVRVTTKAPAAQAAPPPDTSAPPPASGEGGDAGGTVPPKR